MPLAEHVLTRLVVVAARKPCGYQVTVSDWKLLSGIVIPAGPGSTIELITFSLLLLLLLLADAQLTTVTAKQSEE